MDCSLILTFLKMYFVTEEKKTGEASLEVFYRFLFNGQKIVLQMVHEYKKNNFNIPVLNTLQKCTILTCFYITTLHRIASTLVYCQLCKKTHTINLIVGLTHPYLEIICLFTPKAKTLLLT